MRHIAGQMAVPGIDAPPEMGAGVVGHRRPTVVHVVSSLQMGGAERVVYDLTRLQIRSGLAVKVLSLGRSTDTLVADLHALGIEVVSLGDQRSPLHRIRPILHIVGANRADVIHIHSPFGILVLAPLLPFLRGRVVFTRHGIMPLKRLRWRVLLPWARHFVDAVTFVSHESHEVSAWLQRGWKMERKVIENGVDLEVETQRSLALDSRLRIGSVGRLVPLKGQRFLLEAAAALPEAERRRLSVHLFGDGPDRPALEALAATILPDLPVVFHGNVLDRESIYRQIDILAVTSEREGLSLAIMEAMARQIPVVATRVGGNPSLIRPEETGLLVPHGDAVQLAAALQRLITNADLTARLARGGRELMQQQYSLQRTAEQYLKIYGLSPLSMR